MIDLVLPDDFGNRWREIAAPYVGLSYLWGAGAPGTIEPGPRDCSGLVGSLYAKADSSNILELVDLRDRGAVNRPDDAKRTPGGWLWEAREIELSEVRAGDLVGWEHRRHVALVLGFEAGAVAVEIIEAAGGRRQNGESYGRIRTRRLDARSKKGDAQAFYARPFGSIVRRWSDGRTVPRDS